MLTDNLFSKSQLKEILFPSIAKDIIVYKNGNQSLRISEIITYFRRYKQFLLDSLFELNNKYSKEKVIQVMLENMRRSYQFLKSELSDLRKAIYQLLMNKFSPLFFAPENLDRVYDNAMAKIRRNNYRPLTEDSNILFKSLTSSVAIDHVLYIIIHVPIFKGNLMNIYKYLNAPLYLTGSIVVNISPEHDYIAIDRTGAMAKTYSVKDLQNCKIFNTMYHCASDNVVKKDISQICIANILNQQMEQILNTCATSIQNMKHHAVRLSGSTFRLLNNAPVKLTVHCNEPNTANVTYVEGTTFLNLTRQCPTANTPQHLFSRNEKILENHDLMRMKLNSEARYWIANIAKMVNQNWILDLLNKQENNENQPLHLKQLIQRIKTHSFDQYVMIKGYITDIVTYVMIPIFLYYAYLFAKMYIFVCKNKFSCLKCGCCLSSCCKKQPTSTAPEIELSNSRLHSAKSIANIENNLAQRFVPI